MDFIFMTKMTIGEVLEYNAGKAPEKQAVVFGDNSLTFGELNKAANDLCARLFALGIGNSLPDTGLDERLLP